MVICSATWSNVDSLTNRTVTRTVGDRMNPTGERKGSGVSLRARIGVLR
jgi:hypothetical protein